MKALLTTLLLVSSMTSFADYNHTSAPFGAIFGSDTSGLFKEVTATCEVNSEGSFNLLKKVDSINYKITNQVSARYTKTEVLSRVVASGINLEQCAELAGKMNTPIVKITNQNNE